eukprot:15467447-Alexandrium_andersonii.AAC.1
MVALGLGSTPRGACPPLRPPLHAPAPTVPDGIGDEGEPVGLSQPGPRRARVQHDRSVLPAILHSIGSSESPRNDLDPAMSMDAGDSLNPKTLGSLLEGLFNISTPDFPEG